MKRLILVLMCGVLAGCDFSVPLVKAPERAIDPGGVGLWERTNDGQKESLLVLPLGKQEYLVSFPAGSTNAMFAKACLCSAAGKTLVQLEWFGTASAKLPENSRVYQFAVYTIAGDTLTIRLLNADLVNREAKSTAELAKTITDHQDKPELFRDEMVFGRVNVK